MQTIYKGIEVGCEIVDSEGRSVGKVHEVICNAADQLDQLIVQRGLIFKTDISVPAAAIDRFADGKIHLSVDKSTLGEMLTPNQAKTPTTSDDRQTVQGDTTEGAMVQTGVLDRPPNSVSVPPPAMHDLGTGSRTHDMGIGTAGMPGGTALDPAMRPETAGLLDRTQSQEPGSKDRT